MAEVLIAVVGIVVVSKKLLEVLDANYAAGTLKLFDKKIGSPSHDRHISLFQFDGSVEFFWPGEQ